MLIDALYIYPVKSLPALPLQRAKGNQTGLDRDRQYILTDAEGQMMTQRETELMNGFQYHLADGRLELNSEVLQSSVLLPNQYEFDNPVPLTVWGRTVFGQALSSELNDFFSDHLKKPAFLYGVNNHSEELAFYDACQILLINQSSVDFLSEKINTSINIMRFRPNVIVKAPQAFDENKWEALTIRQNQFKKIKICSRCVMINRNPETDKKDRNLLKELAPYLVSDHKFLFGLYLDTPNNFEISVGDEISIS